MTKLAQRKTQLSFETEGIIRDGRRLRNIVIEVDKFGLCGYVRLAGTRKRFPFSWEGVYVQAAKREADRVRAEKRAEKRAAKKGGR